jgi:nucleotide-binding universal stress UspA family protein
MQRFKNILLLMDNEARRSHVFERAIALARRNHARITVAGVLDALPREMQKLVPTIELEDLLELAAEERLAQLELLAEPERLDGLELRTRVLCGRPFLEVIREVLREGHDLVMMMAEEKGKLGKSLFGSTSMHLMRKCPCPVWVMSPAQRHKYSRVLAAVDPATSDEEHQALNVKIMELAISMARIEQAELHVVHAWVPFPKTVLSLSRLGNEDKDALVRDYAAIPKKAFGELTHKFDMQNIRVQMHLIEGQAGEVIPALARNKHVDVIVMGTVCRTGIAGLFIGNTAEKVLSRVKCSVLTVKPDGFATPVSRTDPQFRSGGGESEHIPAA